MILRDNIKFQILVNPELFKDVCVALGRKPKATMVMLYRNSSDVLKGYELMELLKAHTGLEVEEILEPEKVEV